MLIKQYRILKGYTVTKTAVKAGISETLYSKYESGETRMKVHVLLKIAAILHLPPAMLFDMKKIKAHIKEVKMYITKYKEPLDILKANPGLQMLFKLYKESPPNSKERRLLLKLPFLAKEKYDKIMRILDEAVK